MCFSTRKRTTTTFGSRTPTTTPREDEETFLEELFEDEDEDDASSDTFFAALLELYDNWSPSDQRWFLWRSGTLDGVRGSARLRARLLARSENENDRFRDAFPNARDAGDPEDATRRVLDAFVRVFGRTPKTGNDFRLCVRPYAARHRVGRIAEIVHPEKMGWREIEVANGETRFSIARTTRTSREEEEASGGHDVSYTYETRLFRRTCLYFDAQGWCPLEHCAPRRRRTSRFQRATFSTRRVVARERRSGRVGIRRTTRTRRLISDAKRTRTSRSEERHTRTRATRAMAMRARSSV